MKSLQNIEKYTTHKILCLDAMHVRTMLEDQFDTTLQLKTIQYCKK